MATIITKLQKGSRNTPAATVSGSPMIGAQLARSDHRPYSIGKSPMKDVIVEPRTGGRWYEVGEDGSECDWGDVIKWEAPGRVVLAWRIRPDWSYDPKLLTEIDIHFVSLGENSTRVDLEHRLLGNMGEGAEAARKTFNTEPGWSTLLASYGAEVVRALA